MHRPDGKPWKKTGEQNVSSMRDELLRLLENGETSRITIQLSGEDLMELFRLLREDAEIRSQAEEGTTDTLLTKKEVMEMLGVCDTTLWLWAKNNYLKPVKAGRKVLYRKSDVQRFLKSREDRV